MAGYREALWLAIAAAAPIIALSHVVTINDSVRNAVSNHLLSWVPHAKSNILITVFDGLKRRQGRLLYVGLFNLLVSAGVLFISLLSLSFQRNVMPPWIAAIVITLLLASLAWQTLETALMPSEETALDQNTNQDLGGKG